MKFQVIAQIKCNLTGIDLDDQYDRLGFEKRPSRFPSKQITIDVSKEFAREHKDLFGGQNVAYISIDVQKTEASDWEDWGSAGSMLSQSKFTIDRVMSLI